MSSTKFAMSIAAITILSVGLMFLISHFQNERRKDLVAECMKIKGFYTMDFVGDQICIKPDAAIKMNKD